MLYIVLVQFAIAEDKVPITTSKNAYVLIPQIVLEPVIELDAVEYIKQTFPKDWRIMVAIAKAESGLVLTARNKTAVEDSRGIMQINTRVHKVSCNLYTVKCNIDTARKIYNTQGIKA